MFSALTPGELAALYRAVKSGRDRAWSTVGLARQQMVYEASDLLAAIHAENATR